MSRRARWRDGRSCRGRGDPVAGLAFGGAIDRAGGGGSPLGGTAGQGGSACGSGAGTTDGGSWRGTRGGRTPFAGVRLVTLGDGAERGVRALEFRTGTGLAFSVTVDRALDIADCSFRGAPVGWTSPTGVRNPGLHEYEGEDGLGFLRSFTGLLQTCGLDHMLFMDEADLPYIHSARKRVRQSIHGRVSFLPARLTGYGERWEGDRCILWAEGEVVQAAVFGENLVLERRIEAEAGTSRIRIADRVVNRGFEPTPHMMLYHIQAGHPVLDEGSRYLAPIEEVVWAAHAAAYEAQGVGYRRMTAPREGFHEQVWQHRMAADAGGLVPVALVNDGFDGGRGIGLLVETRRDQLPCHIEWQSLQAGNYALGMEPATNHAPGAGLARERGELIVLAGGEARDYEVAMEILDGPAAIAATEARIRALAVQPDTDYPAVSGRFPRLRDGSAT